MTRTNPSAFPFELVLALALAVAAVAIAASSCGGPDTVAPTAGARDPSLSQPIIGGTPDAGHPAVGALLMDDALCSGTLVSPNVVLTAAHCLDGTPPLVFVLGSHAWGIGPVLPVREWVAHPGYHVRRENDAWVAWHDIGVVVLEEPAPVTPMPWRTKTLDGQEGAEVTFVGFGRTDPADDSFGVKLLLDTTLASVWGHGFWNVTTPTDPRNTCHGDSGGPALIVNDGREEVAGVVSSGDAGCVETGYSTRVDVEAGWVAEMVERFASYLPPGAVPDRAPGAAEATDAVEDTDAAEDTDATTEAGAGLDSNTTPASDANDAATLATGAELCQRIGWVGCCDDSAVVWCDEEGLHRTTCGDTLCGWRGEAGFYDCGTDGQEGPLGAARECPVIAW